MTSDRVVMPSSLPDQTFWRIGMNKIWRLAVAALATVVAPKTWAASAAATAATAGVAASVAGIDPWPWVIGGFGAAIVYVKRPAASKPDAVINAMISVLIGGIIAPWAAVGVSEYVSPKLANSYPLALVLSSMWPWLAPVALDKLRSAFPSAQGTGES